MAGSPERKAAAQRVVFKEGWQLGQLGATIDRETAKDMIRAELGEGVRFYR